MPRRAFARAYASVQFIGPTLDPLTVTKALRLPPDCQHRNGEPRLVRTTKGRVQEHAPYRSGLWSMSSERWVDSPRLQTHLQWLLAELEPRAEAVRKLIANGAVVDFFCYSVGATEVPPDIPRAIRERAAALGIEIQVDHYCEGSDEST